MDAINSERRETLVEIGFPDFRTVCLVGRNGAPWPHACAARFVRRLMLASSLIWMGIASASAQDGVPGIAAPSVVETRQSTGPSSLLDQSGAPTIKTSDAPIPSTTALPADAPGRAALRLAARERQFEQLAEDVAEIEKHYAILSQVAKLTRPSVVHVEAEKPVSDASGNVPSDAISFVEEAGSGVLASIGNQVHVLTNRHVINGAALTGIRLELSNGRRLQAREVWTDTATDVAVILVGGENLVPVRLGVSARVEVGDAVLAFGSPFGLNHSVTQGIISAKGRRDLKLGEHIVPIQDFLQTDAAINPGNSGGPLFNLRGELVGINTAIASNSGGNEGIGFAIPIDLVMTVAEQLVTQGKMTRGYLGVKLDSDFTRTLANAMGIDRRQLGAYVTNASQGSPAQAAGIRAGDVIIQFGNTPVEDDGHLISLVGLSPVNSTVPVVLIRDGQEVCIKVTLSPRSS